MSIQKDYEHLNKLLKNHHQSHILAFWDQLDESQRQNLHSQIERLDLTKIDVWIEKFIKNYVPHAIKSDFVPAMSYNSTPVGPDQQRKYTEAVKLGT